MKLRNFIFQGGYNQKETIAMMRKQKYMQMATSSKKGVLPERLPPTEDAIKYHSFRVHLPFQTIATDIE